MKTKTNKKENVKRSATTRKKRLTVPQWAKKFKRPGTEIRNINGYLYLYEITSRYNPAKKRAVKVTLGIIGRVTKEGVIATRGAKRKEALSHIKILEKGLSHWIVHHNSDIKEALKSSFSDTYKEIIVYAYTQLLHQSAIKNYEFFYKNSYLQQEFGGMSITSQQVSNTLQNIGMQREKILSFFKKLSIKSNSTYLLIDSTHIFSDSEELGINNYGYNAERIVERQIKWLLMYDVGNRLPLYYRLIRGNISDVKTMQISIKESGFKDIIIIRR